jgi:adenylate cyclase
VVRGQVELLRQGRLAEVSVLFADIRGFTSSPRGRVPQETVSMLNAFFSAMADVVFRHEGNLDKFIGDCVMAVWGPPSPHADDPARALRAALEMQARGGAQRGPRGERAEAHRDRNRRQHRAGRRRLHGLGGPPRVHRPSETA